MTIKGYEVTWPNVKAYLLYRWQKVFGVRVPFDHVIAFSEMVVYRTKACAECVADGKCLSEKGGCNCLMPAMAFNPKKGCGRSPKKFLPIKSKNMTEDWGEQKREGNFDLFIKYF